MSLSVKVGTYTGDGNLSRAITGVGFALNGSNTMLIIKGGANIARIATTESMAGTAKSQPITGAAGDGVTISSLDADGFTLGSNTGPVNTNGTVYHYLAVTGTDIKTASYTGNSSGPRAITGVGFQPTLVMWWDNLGDTGGFRTTDMPSTDSWIDFGTVGLLTDRVFTLDSDGFTLSFRNEVNGTGRTYYYVALKDSTGAFDTFTYSGNGSDNRDLTPLAFQPDFALVKGTTNVAALRFSTESGDNSYLADATGEAANRIQNFQANGLQVGTAANVNTNAVTYYGWAFKIPATGKAFPFTNRLRRSTLVRM